MSSYTTVGYKTRTTKAFASVIGILFLITLNYLLFTSARRALVASICTGVVSYYIFRILRRTKYIFADDGITIYHTKEKFYTIPKKEILHIHKSPEKKTFFWRNRKSNLALQEKYFTTSNHNLLTITRIDNTKIIISPRVIKPEILTYYKNSQTSKSPKV